MAVSLRHLEGRAAPSIERTSRSRASIARHAKEVSHLVESKGCGRIGPVASICEVVQYFESLGAGANGQEQHHHGAETQQISMAHKIPRNFQSESLRLLPNPVNVKDSAQSMANGLCANTVGGQREGFCTLRVDNRERSKRRRIRRLTELTDRL